MSQGWLITSMVGTATALVGLLIIVGALVFKSGRRVQKLESDKDSLKLIIKTVL